MKLHRAATLIALVVASLVLCFWRSQSRALPRAPEAWDNQTGQTDSGYGSPVHLADLEDRSINESSGIAASRRNPKLFWTHNDSGDGPFIYAFDRQGKHRGVWRIAGASAIDWEDIAVGPGPGSRQSYIYIGDIGDNSRKRDEIIVYRVIEPLIVSEDSSSTKGQPRNTAAPDVIRLKYPDGKHDAETLLVHPSTGDLYIVTKVLGAAAGVYKLKGPLPKSMETTLVHVGDIRFPTRMIGFITGGDISSDGKRVILCDYLGGCELILAKTQAVGFDAIWKQPPVPINLGSRRQGEAICYGADGSALFLTSEGVPCPLIEIPRRRQQ
jgi:hypothetical protein